LENFITRSVARKQAAWLGQRQRAWTRALRLPALAAIASNTRVGTTPHDVVFEHGTLRLLRYRREPPPTRREPVLFCYALVNRPYVLDLTPEKSVVHRYLERGFEVYMIDWGVPTNADRALTLYDYVSVRLARVIHFIRRAHSVGRVHLLGYCMGGTLSVLLTALEPELVGSLTLLAAPIDFSAQRSLLEVWTDRRHFDVDTFIDAHGNCPASFLQTCFLCMRPIENLLEKHIALWEHIDDLGFVRGYFALERWINDNVPVAGATFREFVKHLYQRNELVRGELRSNGRRVELRRIECPLLLLTAKHDHLVPPESTEAIRGHVGSRDITTMTTDAGHVGLVVSSKVHAAFWPAATSWLAERSV
jgi:polyhydroxyalkanoate synthase subunit PhaC